MGLGWPGWDLLYNYTHLLFKWHFGIAREFKRQHRHSLKATALVSFPDHMDRGGWNLGRWCPPSSQGQLEGRSTGTTTQAGARPLPGARQQPPNALAGTGPPAAPSAPDQASWGLQAALPPEGAASSHPTAVLKEPKGDAYTHPPKEGYSVTSPGVSLSFPFSLQFQTRAMPKNVQITM